MHPLKDREQKRLWGRRHRSKCSHLLGHSWQYYFKLVLGEWVKLPQISPEQIQISRLINPILSGDLDAKINSFPTFPGLEKHLLKAMIVRITHGTVIVPRDVYKLAEAEEGKGKPLLFSNYRTWKWHRNQSRFQNPRNGRIGQPRKLGSPEPKYLACWQYFLLLRLGWDRRGKRTKNIIINWKWSHRWTTPKHRGWQG